MFLPRRLARVCYRHAMRCRAGRRVSAFIVLAVISPPGRANPAQPFDTTQVVAFARGPAARAPAAARARSWPTTTHLLQAALAVPPGSTMTLEGVGRARAELLLG